MLRTWRLRVSVCVSACVCALWSDSDLGCFVLMSLFHFFFQSQILYVVLSLSLQGICVYSVASQLM